MSLPFETYTNAEGKECLATSALPLPYDKKCPVIYLMEKEVIMWGTHFIHKVGSETIATGIAPDSTIRSAALAPLNKKAAYKAAQQFASAFFKSDTLASMKDDEVCDRVYICEKLKTLLFVAVKKITSEHLVMNCAAKNYTNDAHYSSNASGMTMDKLKETAPPNFRPADYDPAEPMD